MRISQFAEHVGLPATTLRFYETRGLLPAERSPAGHRLYGRAAVERVAFIRAARRLGLSLEEIVELLDVWSSASCAHVKAALGPRVAGRLAEAEARVADLTAFAALLRRAMGRLDALPERTGRCDARCDLLAEAPVACSLSGADVADRARHWRRLLDGAGREAIEAGVRLSLPAARTAEVAALAADEQRCCPFFDFRLHLDGPVVHLEVRAPASGAPLLAGLFG
jgi:MerR family transcriptional regulator, copper efflux regulator